MDLVGWLVLGVLAAIAVGALVLMFVGYHMRSLRAGPALGCPSVSAMVGSGRNARPGGLVCHRRPGHRYSHAGFGPDGRVWLWPQEPQADPRRMGW